MSTSQASTETATDTQETPPPQQTFIQNILALTQRADALQQRETVQEEDPQQICREINQLLMEVLELYRNLPSDRTTRSQISALPEYKSFESLLHILAEIAQKTEKASAELYPEQATLDQVAQLEKAVLDQLIRHFGKPRSPKVLQAKVQNGEDLDLADIIRTITLLREKLRARDLDIAITGADWEHINYHLAYTKASLRDYLPTREAKPKRPLPQAETGPIDVSWVPRRNVLLKFINYIDKLTDDQVDQLLESTERLTTRMIITIRRCKKEDIGMATIGVLIEDQIEAMPMRLKNLNATKEFAHNMLRYAQLLYTIGSALMTNSKKKLTRAEIRSFSALFQDIRIIWGEAAEDSDQDDEDEAIAPQRIRNRAEMEDPFDDEEPPSSWAKAEQLLAESDSSEDLEELLNPEDKNTQNKDPSENDENPQASDGTHVNPIAYLYYQIRGLFSQGKILETLRPVINDEAAISQKDRLAINLFYLDLLQKIAASEIEGTGGFTTPLLTKSRALDRKGFLSTVKENTLPPNLWRQQNESLQAIATGLEQGLTRMFIDVPPGTGKTRTSITLMQNLNPKGRTLFLEPSIQLCEQTVRALREINPRASIGIIAGNSAGFDGQMTVSTYHSLQKYVQEEMFDPEEYTLIIPDEAHRALTEQRVLISDTFPNAIIVGTTASSRDIGDRNVEDELDLVYRIPVLDGMRAGIVNATALWTRQTSTDLESKGQMAKEVFDEICKGEQTLITVNSTTDANELVALLKSLGIDARTIHSKVPRKDVNNSNELAFRRGRYPILVVCDMLTEGWDHPSLRNLIMLQPPRKEWQFLQQFGRIDRVLPGKDKSNLIVFTDERTDLTALKETFQLNPKTHPQGNLIITPDGTWCKNPFHV